MNPKLDGPKNDSVTPPILKRFGKNVFINADIIIGTNNVPPGIFLIIFILKSPVYFSFKYFNATAPIAFAAMIIESSLIVNFGW